MAVHSNYFAVAAATSSRNTRGIHHNFVMTQIKKIMTGDF